VKIKRIILMLILILAVSYVSIKVISRYNGELGDKITGAIVFGAGLLLSRPKSGSIIMIVMVLALVGYFNRERIEKIIEKIRKKRVEKF